MRAKIFFIALLAIFCCGMANASDVVFPKYTGFVNDYVGVIDAATLQKMESLCKNLEAKTGAELAIAVVKTVEPLDSKTYAVELFQKWGIGKKGKDNGILMLLAMQERRVEIEVGYGLEGVINDAKAGRILDNYVVPSFKQGKWGEGLYNGAVAIADKIVKAGSGEGEAVNTGEEYDPLMKYLPYVIIGFVILIVLSVFFSGVASGLFGAIVGAIMGFIYLGVVGMIIGAVIGFVLSFTRFPTSGMFYGGGFGGGGSGGGGFGGFGGGGSGGGGAGRSF